MEVRFYKERDGSVPVLDWFGGLEPKVQDKVAAWIHQLATFGRDLRRPQADILRDGIHELRIHYGSVNYRLLYFFHGQICAVISHGIQKEKKVPQKEIDLAIRRKDAFQKDPDSHSASMKGLG